MVLAAAQARAAEVCLDGDRPDMAKTVLGYGEGKDRAALIDYMKTGSQNIDPANRAWCASFINASLAQAGYPAPA